MIIKSHVRGGYRSAAEYLKEQGKNEKTRLVEISDPSAKNLDDAFHNMWLVASNTKCTKPLHHISINPMKDERLTDKQVLAIVARCEEKYGYKMFHHQRVIVEHIKDGRQHFHVIWNRVSLMTGRPVWPGEHWKKSKQVCREMERELGLKRPTPKWMKKPGSASKGQGYKARKTKGHYERLSHTKPTFKRSWSHRTPKAARTIIKFNGSDFNGGGIRQITKCYDALSKINPVKEVSQQSLSPQTPVRNKTSWPEAAIIDWQTWGCRDPRRFFALWPELSL